MAQNFQGGCLERSFEFPPLDFDVVVRGLVHSSRIGDFECLQIQHASEVPELNETVDSRVVIEQEFVTL